MSFLKRIRDLFNNRNKSGQDEKTDFTLKHANASSQGSEAQKTANSDDMQDSKALVARERLERMKILTPREWEVYEHLISGLKMRECAESLGITYPTVNFHCQGLYKKLGVNTRAQLFLHYSTLDAEAVRKARKEKT